MDINQIVINKKIKRSYLELISQPRFLQALVASAFAYAVMSFLMTATPISMHVMEKISLTKTGFVIQLHIAAMFLPSLVTGNLIRKFGHSKIMYAGVVLFLITILTSLFEQNFVNYLIALDIFRIWLEFFIYIWNKFISFIL